MWLQRIKDYCREIVDNECLVCGAALKGAATGLCEECKDRIPRTQFAGPYNDAERVLFGRVPFEHAASFGFYQKDEPFAKMISSAKYSGRGWVNHYLAGIFADELTPLGWPFDIDLIVPIPIHNLRLAWRGHNQSIPIAKAFGQRWNLPVETAIIHKMAHTRSQVSRSREDRFNAIDGTFRLSAGQSLAGRHVLLVDDTLTTGATIDACAQIIVKAGARISIATLGLSD